MTEWNRIANRKNGEMEMQMVKDIVLLNAWLKYLFLANLWIQFISEFNLFLNDVRIDSFMCFFGYTFLIFQLFIN